MTRFALWSAFTLFARYTTWPGFPLWSALTLFARDTARTDFALWTALSLFASKLISMVTCQGRSDLNNLFGTQLAFKCSNHVAATEVSEKA
ncbi:MAG: hypothetical protein AAGK37_21845 [Pseudomonadota bacterium]